MFTEAILQKIYNQRGFSRFGVPIAFREQDEMQIRKAFFNNPYYSKIQHQFGDDGVGDFFKALEIKKIQNIDRKEVIWMYVLSGQFVQKINEMDSQQLFNIIANPQQNQHLLFEKSEGTALILTKTGYQSLKQRYETRQLNKKILILSKLPYFGDLPKNQLRTLSKIIPQQSYEKGSTIYKQNQLANKLFVVKSGTFIMNRYNSDFKKQKAVVMLDNFNIFGEQSLQYNNKCKEKCYYICEVSCKSNQGVLFVLDKQIFYRFPLDKHEALTNDIYKMYQQRRTMASNKSFVEQGEIKPENKKTTNYHDRLSRFRNKISHNFIEKGEEINSEIQFFKKQQFVSMKLKLRYQKILDKVKMMNTITLKKIQIGSKSQPKSFTRGIVDSEKKLIIRSLQKRSDSSSRTHSQMMMSALKHQARDNTDNGNNTNTFRIKSQLIKRRKHSSTERFNSPQIENTFGRTNKSDIFSSSNKVNVQSF